MNKLKRAIFIVATFVSVCSSAQTRFFNSTTVTDDKAMLEHFQAPPANTHPWVFWMWLRINTNEAAITLDLEEMHKKGIEGAILYESGAGSELSSTTANMVLKEKKYVIEPTQDFKGAYMTDLPGEYLKPWDERVRRLFRFAAKEAGRLGVKLVLSVGLAGTSGPIPPEFGQKRLVWSQTKITGGMKFEGLLPDPALAVSAGYMPSNAIAEDYKRKVQLKVVPKQTAMAQTIAVLAVPDDSPNMDNIVDISDKIDRNGYLKWNAPEGKWTIMRFGSATTGKSDVWGLFTDAMSSAALDTTWNLTIGKLLKEMKPEEKKGLTGVEDDSWESGESTWTELFPAEFKKQHQYDLIKWLPALAGLNISDSIQSDGVRHDFYRTIADLIAVNHYGHLRKLANEKGLLCYAEACGPNTAQLDGMLNSSQTDFAMGEFWVPSVHRPTPDRRFLLRNSASANHIYGKLVTACEAFTSVGPYWEESLFDLKNTADQAFCDGANLCVIHNFSHSPSTVAKPGFVYFAGTHYSRNVTWWEQTPAFNSYLARCSYMLQQGLFVADALYYRGDAIGHGEQRKTVPTIPGEGYDHDNCNLDVLIRRVSVKNGRFVLPDGMSYKILVLPDRSKIAPDALYKINDLVKSGGIVVGPRPEGIAGFMTDSSKKTKITALLQNLWRAGNSSLPHVISNKTPAEVLHDLKVYPDFSYTGLSESGEIDWIHRRNKNKDIYFIASRWDTKEKISCTFRVTGKQPEIWDAVTGKTRLVRAFTQHNGTTTIPLEFAPRGSVFIIFNQSIPEWKAGGSSTNYAEMVFGVKITGKWELHFDPKWGGPAKLNIDSLKDWTKFSDFNISHYSGTAVYLKKFVFVKQKEGRKIILDLGEVHEEAAVKVNGINMGVVWTKPARIDITRALHSGTNELQITVVNLWPNRLIGDEGLPADQRFTLTNMHKFNKNTPLYPSGLIGPVSLFFSSN